MNRKLLFLVAMLFAAALPASATILVYKGHGTHLTATQTGYSSTEGAYLILDLSAGQATLIYYGLFDHKRHATLALNQVTLDHAQVAGPPHQTYEIFAYVDRSSPGAPFFGDGSAIFRGLVSTVNVNGSAQAYGVENHPHTLSGLYRYVGQGLTTSYDEHATSLAIDEINTLIANNAGETLAQVQAYILGILASAGYAQ